MPGIQTIGFDSAPNGNIDINSGIGDITLTDSATILGPGTSIITVNGGNAGNRIFVDGSGGTLTLNIRDLTLNNSNGFVFPYTLNATGDLAIGAGVGDVTFTKTLNVAAGTLTLTDGNTVDLGITTTVNGTLAAANGFTVGNAETLRHRAGEWQRLRRQRRHAGRQLELDRQRRRVEWRQPGAGASRAQSPSMATSSC